MDREHVIEVREPLTNVVTRQILELLRTEGLSEGDSIPATHVLAERFKVSRTVIRESLAELAGRGMIDRQQGREAVLSFPDGSSLLHLFESRLSGELITFEQLHDFREVIEVGAARLAARHATRTQMATISDRLGDMRTAADERAMLEADVELHRAIAYAAGPVFGLVLDGLSPLLMESRLSAWEAYRHSGGTTDLAVRRHAELRDCIAAGDEEGAATAMVADLEDTRRTIVG